MMATNDAIIRASSRSFLARIPLALANCRSLDLAHGHAGRKQGPDDTPFVATTRLHADRRYRGAAQLLDQFGPAGGVIAHRRTLLVGQHRDVQTILRHVDTTEREH